MRPKASSEYYGRLLAQEQGLPWGGCWPKAFSTSAARDRAFGKNQPELDWFWVWRAEAARWATPLDSHLTGLKSTSRLLLKKPIENDSRESAQYPLCERAQVDCEVHSISITCR